MEWADVISGLKVGKKYRRQCWDDEWFIEFFKPHILGPCADDHFFTIEDFEANDWEEVE